MTHTYSVLPVSMATYDEIRKKLEDAGYQDQFIDDGYEEVIDMHGIAIGIEDKRSWQDKPCTNA